MPLPLLAAAGIVGGASLVSGLIEGISGYYAGQTQAATAQQGIDEQRRQFEVMKESLRPYTETGAGALSAQADLAGINGPEKQAAAMAAISGGAEMQAMAQQGENAMLQNASATGGLRGGNLQGALAQYRPQVLSQLINQQYGRLGSLSQMGQASAAGVGAGALQTGANVANSMGQYGAAQAGSIMSIGQGINAIPNAITSGLGAYAGLGGKF